MSRGGPEAGVEQILEWLADTPTGQRPRILIDGPSGSGKTTLAEELGRVQGVPVYGSESWTPGWEGLEVASRITEQLVSGVAPSYRMWDWETYNYGDEMPFDALGPWIIEGCGALTPASAAHADLRVWVEADGEVAKARGLARDGEVYAQHWDSWHQQELKHWERNDPKSLADLIIRTG